MKAYSKNDVDVTFSNQFMDLEQLTSFDAILIPKGATNGDMIKAMFPNAEISLLKSEHEKTKVAVEWKFEPLPNYYNLFFEDWWNAPYREVEI